MKRIIKNKQIKGPINYLFAENISRSDITKKNDKRNPNERSKIGK